MDFGDLKDDKAIQEKLTNFSRSINKIEETLQSKLDPETYKKLSLQEKVNYDLFMTYALNTLFWIYLKTRGIDPYKNEVKNQLNRIKQHMVKAKEAHLRNTARPKIDRAVAARFIKHGIEKSQDEPPSKKQK